MDLFKYVVFLTVFITVLGMAQYFNEDGSSWNEFISDVEEDNLQAQQQNVSNTMSTASEVYNPQNENTQSEGTGGIGVSTMTAGVFKFFGTAFETMKNQQALAEQGKTDTNPFNSMINVSLVLFFAALGILLTVKLYQFIKFGN